MKSMDIEAALQWRYACKKFDPSKKISGEDWATLQKALQNSPSSFGLQPYRFLLIENQTLREKLKSASWNQTQVTDCSHFLVATSRSKMTEDDVDRFVHLTATTRGFPPETMKNYRDMMVGAVVKGYGPDQALAWTRRQAYLAIGFLLETAALLRIDATPMEGLDASAYDTLLNLQGSGYQTVAAVALGYRHTGDDYQKLAKVRFPVDQLIEVIR